MRGLARSLLRRGLARTSRLLPAAYYTSRHRFRSRAAFLILALATQMLQPTALIVALIEGRVVGGLTAGSVK